MAPPLGEAGGWGMLKDATLLRLLPGLRGLAGGRGVGDDGCSMSSSCPAGMSSWPVVKAMGLPAW